MRRATTRPLSRLRKPEDLSLDAWQRELRRQFGREAFGRFYSFYCA